MKHLTFRNSKIVYYGPHDCQNCGVAVVKMGMEFGGNTFNNPNGPIYPNTEWHPHVCDQNRVKRRPQPAVNLTVPNSLRPPFETFTGPTCRGCLSLGNACGFCEKCVWEKKQGYDQP